MTAGTLAVLVACLLWGTTGTAATFAHHANGLAIGAGAMGISGVVLVLITYRRSRALIRTRNPSLWLGAGCVVIYPLAFYTSMAYAGVAIGNTLALGGAPIAAALIEGVRYRNPLTRRWTATATIAVIGATLLALGHPALHDHTPSHEVAGIVLGIVAAVAYAGYSVAAAELIQDGADSRAAMGAMFGLAATILLPILLIAGTPLTAATGLLTTANGILVIAYLALVPMSIGYLLFGYALTTTGAREITVMTLLEPAVAAVLADLVADQHLTPLGWAGIALVIASVLLQAQGAQRAHREIRPIGSPCRGRE